MAGSVEGDEALADGISRKRRRLVGIARNLGQWGTWRVARRLSRSIPLLGAGIALLALRHGIRRKGFRGGVADATLDALPFVGAAKNLIEMVRGDFIRDRQQPV